ncbi:lasso peptide biosynthesis B2 protein [Streptomyces sp. NRRL S-118]|uniref:lasso peptide biosynthesis B2 protein n=1 Tax=Streptomyces sp. NRRL S-118 TaxID=1463881 RepID=UPI0004C7BB90|nr:lasso peptide biosynthesis B2 protein [Streptomyces sp. NRRL S-118]
MSQVLDGRGAPLPFRHRCSAHLAVGAARLLAHLSPKRLGALLTLLRRGARPATYDEALRARGHVTTVSTLCAGTYCLPRSLATVLLCRMRGVWPTWCTGVRTPPFSAHAWVEAEGRRVGEPAGTAAYRPLLVVPPHASP